MNERTITLSYLPGVFLYQSFERNKKKAVTTHTIISAVFLCPKSMFQPKLLPVEGFVRRYAVATTHSVHHQSVSVSGRV